MKKLLILLSALTALTLVAPGTGFAQDPPPADNQFGLFFDQAGTVNNFDPITQPSAVPFPAYLVLLNPTDALDNPVAQIEAFEVMVSLDNTVNVFRLVEDLPEGAINVGNTDDLAAMDYTVGLAAPIDVVNGSVVVVTFSFMKLDTAPVQIYLNNSVNGFMQFQDANGKVLVQAYPASGDMGSPVAGFFLDVVPVDHETWGGVKALYR